MNTVLRAVRTKKGLSIDKVKGVVGVNKSSFSRWEVRLQRIGRERQEALAAYFGMKREELFDERDFARVEKEGREGENT